MHECDSHEVLCGHLECSALSFSGLLVLQTRLADLRDGQELVGTVFRQMLYHGAQIDIGADYDGCALGFLPPAHL